MKTFNRAYSEYKSQQEAAEEIKKDVYDLLSAIEIHLSNDTSDLLRIRSGLMEVAGIAMNMVDQPDAIAELIENVRGE